MESQYNNIVNCGALILYPFLIFGILYRLSAPLPKNMEKYYGQTKSKITTP